MESESSLVFFVVAVVVVFVRVPVVVVLVVFGLFFSEAFVPLALPAAAALFVAVAFFGSLFNGSSLPFFVVAATSLAGAAVFFGCAVDGFGSVVGDGDVNVFFGGSIFFVDELSNFFAISNESISNESRFAVDGFVTFLVGAVVFLSSLAFDLPAASDAVFS